LEHVPKDMRTKEMCRIAVAQNGWALCHVPQALRDELLCERAVTQNGLVLREVPRALRTENICRLAVLQDGYAWRDVPEGLRETVRQYLSHSKLAWHNTLLDELADLLQANSETEKLKRTYA
jgi:hypothetical protein